MTGNQEERLFEAGKIEWLLDKGLNDMDAGDRHLLLVMAETKLTEGYEPTAREKRVIERLRALAGQDYDARDVKRKVRTMVNSPTRGDTPGLSLPPAFDHLLKRLRRPKTGDDKDTG
jgi:hypothetical protein